MQIDVKITDKILANRLSNVITSSIHSNQLGFIHGLNSSDRVSV